MTNGMGKLNWLDTNMPQDHVTDHTSHMQYLGYNQVTYGSVQITHSVPSHAEVTQLLT